MSKREGKSIGNLAGLGEAFEGQALPEQEEQAFFEAEPTLENREAEPVAETDKTAGDLIIFKGQQYLFHGYDENGRARLYDETDGTPREAFVTREQLLEGFRLARDAEARVDAGVAADIEEAIKMGEVTANARMLNEVAAGTPEKLAVEHLVNDATNEVELLIKQSTALPTPEQEIALPIAIESEPAPVAPEGEVAQEDKAERAKQLQEEAERALALDGEIRALNKKHGTQHEVSKLYEERDRLNEHIHGLLKEIAPETLGVIRAEDFTAKKPMTGDSAEVDAYNAAQRRRNGFLGELTQIGIPRYLATKIYRSEVEAIHEFKKIIDRAEAGDKRALSTKKAKRLLSRFGVNEEGVGNFKENIETREPQPVEIGEFAQFATRGNGKLVSALPDIEAGDVTGALSEEQNMGQRKAGVVPTAAEVSPVASPEANATLVERNSEKGELVSAGRSAVHHELRTLPTVLKAEIVPPEIKGELHKEQAPTAVEHVVIAKEKEQHIVSASVIEKFGSEGVGFEELKTIPGFLDMSEGQQLLMLKNYSTALVSRVKNEAKKEADEAWGKRSFLGKVGLSMITMGLAKNVAEQARQRDIARKLSSGEHLVASERRTMLEAFAKVAQEGPEVEKEQDGSLRLNYLSTERFKDDPDALAIVEAYNAAATSYAKIPKQWIDADVALNKAEQPNYFAKLLGTKNTMLSGKEHLQVAESKDTYRTAREQLLALLERHEGGEKGPEARRKAMLELNGLDERVQLNQLFSSNPDAEEALQHIRDSNVFTRSISEFAKNRGQYMAYGAVTRIAAVAALGAVAFPATAAIAGGAVAVGVAGAVGYFQSRREAKELLKTRRASGMLGEEDLREHVVFTVKNEEELTEKEEERDAAFARGDKKTAVKLEGDIRILREKLKMGEVTEQRTKQLKEFRDAQFYTDRVERLISKLDVANEMGDKESAEILERKIAQTATLMRGLMQQGMVSFGQENRLKRIDARAAGNKFVAEKSDARSALNGLAFMQALGHADAVHSLDMSAIEEKMSSILEGYRAGIDATARKRSNKHIAKAVALRVGFGLAGYGLAHAGANLFGGHGFEDSGASAQHGSDWGEAHQADWGEHGTGFAQAAGHTEVSFGAHAVTSGETLTAIVRKFPEISKLPSHSQEVAIANLMKRLSPEQLRGMGISSGNVNMIRVGEHIDLNKLHEQLSSVKIGSHDMTAHVGVVQHEVPRVPSVISHEAAHDTAPSQIHGERLADSSVGGHPQATHETFRESVLAPKRGGEHVTTLRAGESSPEIAAIAQNKLNKKVSEIFGQKTIFGRDHMKEWEGDPLRKIHGLKDASAESLFSKHRGLLAETRTRVQLRDYVQELSKNSHVEPRTGETVSMYIKRALLEQETAARHSVVVSAPVHKIAGAAMESHVERAASSASELNTAIVAAADRKMETGIREIFGHKGFGGRDHMSEWTGNPVRHAVGLKDTSVESVLARRAHAYAETGARADLARYIETLRSSTGVAPLRGETAGNYIKRALFAEQQLAVHRAAGTKLVENAERVLDESAADTHRPLEHVVKDFGDNHASELKHAEALRSTYRATAAPTHAAEHVAAPESAAHATAPVAEAARHIETVHSTDEALNTLMPKLFETFPQLNNGNGVNENTIAAFLHDAKPEQFKALGLDGADMHKYLGGGKVDAFKIAEYFKTHHQGAVAAEHVTPIVPEDAASTVHMPPLSHENVVAMERQWDVLSEVNKAEAAARMVPDYAKQEIAARVKGLNVEKFMNLMEKMPVKFLYESKEQLLTHVDPQAAEGIIAVHDIALQKHFIGPDAGANLDGSLAAFIQNAYIKRMLEGGPAAVK